MAGRAGDWGQRPDIAYELGESGRVRVTRWQADVDAITEACTDLARLLTEALDAGEITVEMALKIRNLDGMTKRLRIEVRDWVAMESPE